MKTNFEKSDIYEKALEEYNQKVYGAMLKPMHSFVVDEDEVYLIYPQEIVDDILLQMCDIWASFQEYSDYVSPVHLWYQVPEVREITLLNQKYKSIYLWYDHSEVPMQFQAKI